MNLESLFWLIEAICDIGVIWLFGGFLKKKFEKNENFKIHKFALNSSELTLSWKAPTNSPRTIQLSKLAKSVPTGNLASNSLEPTIETPNRATLPNPPPINIAKSNFILC